MTTESTQPPNDPNRLTLKEALNFVREENKRDREHLNSTFNRVVWAATAILGIAVSAFIFLTSKSLNETRESVRADVQRHIDVEFSTPELRKTIEQAARKAAERESSKAIQDAVRDQVAIASRRIQEQASRQLNELTPRKITDEQAAAFASVLQKHEKELQPLLAAIRAYSPRLNLEAENYAKLLARASTIKTPDEHNIRQDKQVIFTSLPTDLPLPRGISFGLLRQDEELKAAIGFLQEALTAAKIPYRSQLATELKCNSRLCVFVGGK